MPNAHFWFADGVEVFPDVALPDPPPPSYSVVIKEPMNVLASFLSPVDAVPVQSARFHLTDYAIGGEIAHYELSSAPPRGWRWLAVNGRIHAERISQPEPANG